MANDAVAKLEATRQKFIKNLLKKRDAINEQLKGLGYEDKKAA